MGVFTYYLEFPLTVSPTRMFSGLIRQAKTLIPTVVPLVINRITANNDGTKVVTFGRGCPYDSVKLRTNAIDENENFTYSFIIFEGDALREIFESISYHIKFVAPPDCPDGGSIYNCWTTFITKGDYHVTETDIQSDKAYQTEIVKAIEAYLYANPDN